MTEQGGEPGNYVVRALELFADHGDREAIVAVDDDIRLTYADARTAVLSWAMTVRDQGIGKGAGVAMLVKNKPEAVFLQLALHLLGCRTVWIATYAPYRDQADFVRLANAEVLVYHTETKRGGRLVESLSQQEKPIMMFSLGPDDKGTDLLAAPRSRAPAHQHAAAQLARLDGPEPESLFYTRGTNRQPKLVHHRREFFEVLHAIAAFYLAMGEPPMRFLSCSGFSHVSVQIPALL